MMITRAALAVVLALGLLAAPLAAGAQSATPVIGYLSGRSAGDSAQIITAFRQGLRDAGFVEGQSVVIEYRFAEGRYDRLPTLAADLVRHPVNLVVATGGTISAVAAKRVVPATLPIVFAMGGDPVKLGVVASLGRPGGNMTGVSFLVNGLAPKQLQLLREVAPKAAVIGFLVNPNNPNLPAETRATQEAADTLGHKLVVVKASAASDFDPAFATLVQERVAAVFVDVDPLFVDQRTHLAALAARHRLPAIYALREFVDAGGLMSYGTSITEANRQLGLYTGRVLKGTKPADLPVLQSTRFELVINLKTARALGLTIPPSLLGRADEIIE
jgi:ABC-type uncharacterized transport system substrate-binding protein